MTRRRIGMILSILGGLIALGSVVLLACMELFGERELIRILLLIVMFIFGMVLGIIGCVFRLYWYDSKKRKRMAAYSKYPCREIWDYQKELEVVRMRFARDKSRRKNTFQPVHYLKAAAKPFFNFNVLETGKIFYGYIVQANEMLFSLKDLKYSVFPAVVIYSPDEYYERFPLTLKEIAEALFAERDNNILNEKETYFLSQRVSDELTEGRVVYMTTIMIYRSHLPILLLSDSLIPLIADPNGKEPVFVVDEKYWTLGLIGNFLNETARFSDLLDPD